MMLQNLPSAAVVSSALRVNQIVALHICTCTLVYSFPTGGDFFCHQLITFAIKLNPDQARQNIGSAS